MQSITLPNDSNLEILAIGPIPTTPNSPLTFSTPPTASLSPATGTTTGLSATGHDTAAGALITYTWSAFTVPFGAAPPTFSAGNGTTSGNNITATFYAAGTYVFTRGPDRPVRQRGRRNRHRGRQPDTDDGGRRAVAGERHGRHAATVHRDGG